MHPVEDGAERSVPVHVAIIMDGNGRWAKRRGLPRIAGHRRGADALRVTVEAAAELGIRHLTLFGFSSENWGRPSGEVEELMGLLRMYLRAHIAELHANNVRLTVIGARDRLPGDVVDLIAGAERQTAGNSRLHLQVALSYGARDEIVAAARSLAADVAAGTLAVDQIDAARLADRLQTRGVPDPDLVIRTSGEQRLSNFLLWQAAYAELVFVDTLWPDFKKRDLDDAIREYQQRERRFGVATG
ncbi:MAG: isoprenyl transferase [Alphaproteobacteria bacterium]|nr:isoprenyl transferase [Alphaproteobacteria bacterium]